MAWATHSLGSRLAFHTDKKLFTNKEAQERGGGQGKQRFLSTHSGLDFPGFPSFSELPPQENSSTHVQKKDVHLGLSLGVSG